MCPHGASDIAEWVLFLHHHNHNLWLCSELMIHCALVLCVRRADRTASLGVLSADWIKWAGLPGNVFCRGVKYLFQYKCVYQHDSNTGCAHTRSSKTFGCRGWCRELDPIHHQMGGALLPNSVSEQIPAFLRCWSRMFDSHTWVQWLCAMRLGAIKSKY